MVFRGTENKTEVIIICLIQHFEADFHIESQPQNAEFRNIPENFHPWNAHL